LTSRLLDLDPQPSFDLLVAYRKDDKLPALACFLSVVREHMNKPFPALEDSKSGSHTKKDGAQSR